ncbi:hypothetical protein DT076_11180 [Desertihabitans brevis]|uniref:Uncharacterized protein n=1 Tax=Desertihabitans brevis TaxID=2268447 RepID=A0A367YUE4_9ACTN|nr:hypothetical protein [Desertihabitans brevis]RCK69438.1 hypothetical protein DT076_11180 [Desertihabitans brevis]
MPAPKTFSPEAAVGESFRLDASGRVYVYRFGDRSKGIDWLSRRRQGAGGGFPRPGPEELNDWALKQSSYGSSSENVADNPFLSVATDPDALYAHGEGWVQKILEAAPTLGVFLVPAGALFRPSPTKLISRSETEWLYYDGDAPITDHLEEWLANPLLD